MSGRWRRWTAIAFVDYRWPTEAVIVVLATGAFLVVALSLGSYDTDVDDGVRSTLYASLTGTTAALLGFVLAGLAVLVALPSGERITTLRQHPRWPRVPGAFVRASGALLVALVLSTVGIAVDHHSKPDVPYEAGVVAAVAWALARVVASVVALDQVLAVADADHGPPDTKRYSADVNDP